MKITRRNFLQMLGITGVAAGGISQVWAIPDQVDRKVTGRSPHRNMEDVHLRPMPCRVRHPGPFDRRDPGPDFRQSHRTGQQRVHLSHGGGWTGTALSPRPDPPAHAAQRKKGGILLGAHLLGRSSRPDFTGASGVVEEKTGRSFRVFLRRPEHAAHALCRGSCDPHGLNQLFPLADSGHQRTRFLAGVSGNFPPLPSTWEKPITFSRSGQTSLRGPRPRSISTASTGN